MAAYRGGKSAGSLVADALELTLECGICRNHRELHMLPCQHMMCLECLDTILTSCNQICSFCREMLKEDSATMYPVCRLASHLQQEIQQLTQTLQDYHYTEQENSCEMESCTRPIDFYCSKCIKYLCFRCSSCSTCVNGESHESQIYNENLKKIQREKYENWRFIRESKIEALMQEHNYYNTKIQTERSASNIPEKNTTTQIIIQSITKQVTENMKVLKAVDEQINNTIDLAYIKIVDKLFSEKSKNYKLSLTLSILNDNCCYDVSASEGRIYIGRNSGFHVIKRINADSASRDTYRDISTSQHENVSSIQRYEGLIYVLCKSRNPQTTRQVIVFNPDYTELRRWSVPDSSHITHLAVVNNKVYVVNPSCRELCVYSVETGEQISSINRSFFIKPAHLSVCPPNSILISDSFANHVCRIDCRNERILWTTNLVERPAGICFESVKNEVWVWSQGTNSIFVLDSLTGKLKQKVTHSKFSEFGGGDSISGMCIQEGILWVAARGAGLLKFDIVN